MSDGLEEVDPANMDVMGGIGIGSGTARPRYPDSLIRRLAALADGGSVLDACAGTGELARGLAATGLSVVALEASEARIALGRQQPHGKRVRWLQGSAERARLGGPYDLVIAGDAIGRLDWARALPRLGRAASGWFAAVGRGDRIDGGAEALSELLASWSGRRDERDGALFVTRQRRFRRVGHWRARSQTVLQPVPIFVRSLHSQPGLSVAELGPERVEAFHRAVEAVLDRHHGGMVRIVTSPWVVWGRIPRGLAPQA